MHSLIKPLEFYTGRPGEITLWITEIIGVFATIRFFLSVRFQFKSTFIHQEWKFDCCSCGIMKEFDCIPSPSHYCLKKN